MKLIVFFSMVGQLHAAAGAPHEGISGVEMAKILGLGFSVLTLLLIIFASVYYRKSPFAQTARWLHLLSLCVIPVFVLFLGNFVAYEEAKELTFCASCHPVMDPYVNDLKDSQSATLASIHNQRRVIQEAQCYACHVGYGINGTGKAKLNGLIHLYKFFTGAHTSPIELYEPYTNDNCLRCHLEGRKFEASATHGGVMELITSNGMSCLDCHTPVHPAQVASK